MSSSKAYGSFGTNDTVDVFHVLGQVAQLSEGFRTLNTFEGSLLGVDAKVVHEVVSFFEKLFARTVALWVLTGKQSFFSFGVWVHILVHCELSGAWDQFLGLITEGVVEFTGVDSSNELDHGDVTWNFLSHLRVNNFRVTAPLHLTSGCSEILGD